MKPMLKYTFVVVATFAVTACSKGDADKKTPEEMPVEVALPEVDSVTLHKSYPGYITANAKVDVKCLVDGRLLSRNFEEGDYVHKGQTLYTVDASKYRDAVQQAQAQLATAQSNYKYYTQQYEAMQRALKADAVSQMDVNQAESNMNTAAASIKSAQAALQTANTNLGYCTIKAPISGYISTSAIDVGNYISGAAQPVTMCTIYDDSSFSAVFSIEDAQFEQMIGDMQQENNEIEIPLVFSTDLPHSYVARLSYVDVAVDRSTGTLTLKADVDNPYNELRNGMYVKALFPYGTTDRALLVKDAAIGTDQAGEYLYTVNDSNKVVYTPIVPGDIYNDSLRIVEKGITADTRYVTKAMLRVRDGMKVKPVMTP